MQGEMLPVGAGCGGVGIELSGWHLKKFIRCIMEKKKLGNHLLCWLIQTVYSLIFPTKYLTGSLFYAMFCTKHLDSIQRWIIESSFSWCLQPN